MNWLMNMALKFSGAGAIWAKVDGAKTYIVGGISVLSGLVGLLQELVVLIDGKDFAAVWRWAQHLPQDQAWLMFVAGLGAIGLRHAQAKAIPDPSTPPVAGF